MDNEEKLYLILKRPPLVEMMKIMAVYHNSIEYLEGRGGDVPASVASSEFLRKHGWGYKEYCRAIGTMP